MRYRGTGITFVKCKKKWQAYIGINGRMKALGYFRFKKDALEARKKAMKALKKHNLLTKDLKKYEK